MRLYLYCIRSFVCTQWKRNRRLRQLWTEHTIYAPLQCARIEWNGYSNVVVGCRSHIPSCLFVCLSCHFVVLSLLTGFYSKYKNRWNWDPQWLCCAHFSLLLALLMLRPLIWLNKVCHSVTSTAVDTCAQSISRVWSGLEYTKHDCSKKKRRN